MAHLLIFATALTTYEKAGALVRPAVTPENVLHFSGPAKFPPHPFGIQGDFVRKRRLGPLIGGVHAAACGINMKGPRAPSCIPGFSVRVFQQADLGLFYLRIPLSVLAILSTTPIAAMTMEIDVPPALNIGSGRPVVGIMPVTTATFITN